MTMNLQKLKCSQNCLTLSRVEPRYQKLLVPSAVRLIKVRKPSVVMDSYILFHLFCFRHL